MRKIMALAVALSFFIITGCTSTSIKYKTPKLTNVKIQNVNDRQLFFSTRASFAGEPYMDAGRRGFIQGLIEHEFDQIFAETAANLDTFSSVNKTFFKKNESLPVVSFDVEVRQNNNPLVALLTLCSLGIIPNHSSTDFTVTCQYNSAGKSRMYTFEDTLSTWVGWFVGGTADPYEGKYKERLLLENISRHALVKYDQDSSEDK